MTDTARKIYNKLDDAINNIFFEMQNELGIDNGDAYPEDVFDLDDMEEKIAEKIEQMLERQREFMEWRNSEEDND